MDALTLDLVFTVAASVAVLACGVLGIAVLPWKEDHWVPLPTEDPACGEALHAPSRS